MDYNVNITRLIQLKRGDTGMTMQQLADQMGLSLAQLKDRMAGRKAWSIPEMDTAASVFGMLAGDFAKAAELLP